MNLGASFKKQSVPVDPNILARGIKDALAGGKTALTEDQARATLMEVQTEMRKKQQEEMQAAGEASKKEGAAFLAANKSKDGVVTLPSGLQYKILTQGTGPKPTASDSVVCNYRGTLINGTEFDSSYKRGEPATFPVNGVIKGWTEALQLMPVGSKWQLFVPSDLAYGERSPAPEIGPDSTLIFEVELLSIQNKSADRADVRTRSSTERKRQQRNWSPGRKSRRRSICLALSPETDCSRALPQSWSSGPWPGTTTVSSGRASTFSCSELMIFCIDPPGRSVRPMLPANNVSPAISFFSAGKYRQTLPSVCPGV